jgi:hypothetical protein
MPTQPEPSQSAVDLLDHALGRVDMVRACLDELRRPDAALVASQTLVERAESCLDDVLSALRSLRRRLTTPEAAHR